MSISARFLRSEAANVVILFGLLMTPLVGAVGAGLDYARAADLRAKVQGALDAAVLAGARETGDRQTSSALAAFDANADLADEIVLSPTFAVDQDGVLTGTADISMPTAIMGIMRIPTLDMRVTASARSTGEGQDVCLLLVDPSAHQALLANGGARLTAPDCEIHVKSTRNPAAIFNGNTQMDVERICVAGPGVIVNGNASPPVETSCDTISNPLAGTLPEPPSLSCDHHNRTFNPGSHTLSPGVYCGHTNFNGSGNITLQPGVYVIRDGTFTVNGNSTVAGDGVTFHLANQGSDLRFNGNVDFDIRAPESGTYKGIALYEPDGLAKSQLVFNGSNAARFEGLVYLPSRNVTINGASNVQAKRQTMVFNTLIINAASWAFESAERRMTSGGGGGGATLVR